MYREDLKADKGHTHGARDPHLSSLGKAYAAAAAAAEAARRDIHRVVAAAAAAGGLVGAASFTACEEVRDEQEWASAQMHLNLPPSIF